MAIQWRDTMSIDGGPIDDDHKHWLKLAMDLDAAFEGGMDREKVTDCLNKLQYYTVYHFAREESLQKEINYPDSEAHIEKHKQLRDVVKNAIEIFNREISDGKSEELRDKVSKLIGAWIVGHIVKQDIPMRDYVRMHHMGTRQGPHSLG